jgi:hypothetical protein
LGAQNEDTSPTVAADDLHGWGVQRDYTKRYADARYTWGLLGVLFLLLTLLLTIASFLPEGEGGCLHAPRWVAVFPIAFFGFIGFICARRGVYWHRMIARSRPQPPQDRLPF